MNFRRMLVAFNKPFRVLSQFTPDGSPNQTLANFGFPKNLYPIGRLDADSEGLLLLSDEPGLNGRLLDPKQAHERIYWVQVERIPNAESLERLARGLELPDGRTRPCRAWLLDPQPVVEARQPPIRLRKSVPDCWIAMALIEGKNRQVRRMTAAIGHPTLRLVRVQIGNYAMGDLLTGQWKVVSADERRAILGQAPG